MASSLAGSAFALGSPLLLPARPALAEGQRLLTAVRRTIAVKGRPAQVFGITEANGAGPFVMTAGERFRVRVENRIGEPTSLHWHGLTPPWRDDGVAGLTQEPIPDGDGRDYDFAVARPGTHWMHSHFGLQEQRLLAAPLIVRDPAEAGADVQEVVVMFHDFTFRDPREIMAELAGGAGHCGTGHAGMGHGGTSHGGTGHGGMGHTGMGHGAMATSGHMAHGGHGSHSGHGGAPAGMAAHLQDVAYDALLANDRTLDDPEIVAVEGSGRVRLRLINGAASTNLWVDLGTLGGRLVAVDGMPVEPLAGSRFELAVAQRLDILVDLPRQASAWPVLAVQEGGRLRAGIILAAPAARVDRLGDQAEAAYPAVGIGLEQRLRAATPLAARAATRRHDMILGEGAGYVWTLDGAVHGRDRPLAVRRGDRFELTFVNRTSMSHPMHLHGHHFQVVAVNGRRFQGALRDTVLVPAGMGSVTVAFDADNPGRWALHCHHLYHMEGGMMTSMAYEA
ncbi:multicopper oxidase family protein [Phreatobacter sp. AB_2022a]|uniref:multicopper oxidase family protein n=1 Tax=Phreatobacter sp. AB_2022a TaxID=3003134 RepID=UPI0022874E5E|nr:multicopper oxidase domain-containing protein [Phreatobacter sp. AB_2022a]MCZ0737670.1 multicopper oxidase domain-containing protein [Phreatobacter sp. AB_2022a]